jgi:hypothetical protein
MTSSNLALPQQLQTLIASLSFEQALPFGIVEGMPFIAVKIKDEDETILVESALTCEFKPSIFNLDYKEHTVSLCIVQFRFNGSDRHIYTAGYDLHNSRQYEQCEALLKMLDYGLLIATEHAHIYKHFSANFVGTFNPVIVIREARDLATDYDAALCSEVMQGLTIQKASPAELWRYFEQIAPPQHRWYLQVSSAPDSTAS